jgi:hypothetical protein
MDEINAAQKKQLPLKNPTKIHGYTRGQGAKLHCFSTTNKTIVVGLLPYNSSAHRHCLWALLLALFGICLMAFILYIVF